MSSINYSCDNNLENAKRFLDNERKRKAPNNRVNGYHFLDIANIGAGKILKIFKETKRS